MTPLACRRCIPVVAGLAVLAWLVPPLPAAGAAVQPDPGPVTWGVAPAGPDGPDGRAAYHYRLDPGAVLTDHLAVSNLSTRRLTVAVYASDAFTTLQGGFDLLPAGQPPTGVGAWVRFGGDELTIPGRSRVVVPFRLVVPADATPGDHTGGVVAAVAGPSDGSESGVRVDRRVGARIYLRVSGQLRPVLSVEQLRAGYAGTHPFGAGVFTVTYTIRNTGNVRLAAQPLVSVTGPLGLGRRDREAGAVPEILPGGSVTLTTPVTGAPPLIRLAGTVTVTPAAVDGARLDPAPVPATARVAVWAVPWLTLGLLLLLVGLAATGYWQWRQRRRHRGRGPAGPPAADRARAPAGRS